MTIKLKDKLTNPYYGGSRIYSRNVALQHKIGQAYNTTRTDPTLYLYGPGFPNKIYEYSKIELWVQGESTTTSGGGVQPRAFYKNSSGNLVIASCDQHGPECWGTNATKNAFINRTNSNLVSARNQAWCSFMYHLTFYPSGNPDSYVCYTAESYGGSKGGNTESMEMFTGRINLAAKNFECIGFQNLEQLQSGLRYHWKAIK